MIILFDAPRKQLTKEDKKKYKGLYIGLARIYYVKNAIYGELVGVSDKRELETLKDELYKMETNGIDTKIYKN